jgi:predicted DNA-binding transcriptional regulator YafY
MTTPKKNPPERLPSDAEVARSDPDRRLRQADRLARLLRVLQLLLSRGRWNARDIAAEQECSERTVYRDMQVLQLAGLAVEYDRDGKCYRLAQDVRLPALNVTEDEALGQATAAVIATAPGLDVSPGANPVSRKLASVTKEDVGQILTDAGKVTAVLDLKLANHSGHRDVVRTIQKALLNGKQLTGTYRSPHEASEVTLQLHPYRLCLVKQAWYLIARPVSQSAPLTLRVARFRSLRSMDHNAEVPTDFDLRGYFGNAWGVYRGDRSYDVEVVFTREAAATVTEVVWHHTQKVRTNRDGSVRLSFRVDGLNEIVRWVLGWGNRATVVSPPELRSLVVSQLWQSLEAYQS